MHSYKSLREELEHYQVKPDKEKGQHFLVDDYTISVIVENLGLSEDDILYEIGPGTGRLTDYLFGKCGSLNLIEIDEEMIAILEDKFEGINIIQQDILKFEFPDYQDRKIKVVGNLPYYITSPILERIVAIYEKLERAICMMQTEVAQRILASPGGKEYGRLTVFIQNFFDVKLLKKVAGRMFYPPTKISSSVLLFTPREKPIVDPELHPVFEKVVKAAFIQRRKNLANCLKNFPDFREFAGEVPAILEEAGIDSKRRGETLGFDEFIEISRIIKDKFDK